MHGEDARAIFADVLEKAETASIPAPGCLQSVACQRNVTADDIRFNMEISYQSKHPGQS